MPKRDSIFSPWEGAKAAALLLAIGVATVAFWVGVVTLIMVW